MTRATQLLCLTTENITIDSLVRLCVVFKSDRGALSAKDERETLLTTRSSSEKLLFSVVLTSGVVESVIELFIRSLTS